MKLGDNNQITHNALMKKKYVNKNDCQNLNIFVHSYSWEGHMVASRSL